MNISKNFFNATKCPNCGSNWVGGSIFESFVKQREQGVKYFENKSDEEIQQFIQKNYSPPYVWKRQISIIGQEKDICTKIMCPDCRKIFDIDS